LNGEFSEILSWSRKPDGSPNRIRTVAAQGRNHLLVAVAMILGCYPLGAPEHEANRTNLRNPVQAQDAAIAAALRSRCQPTDVDPGTGASVGPETPGAPSVPA
jgi:hypothetical protein